MLQWGTAFTHDCCSRMIGSITKVWQPFTSSIHTRKMSDINELLSKLWLDFCQILNFLPLQEILVQHVAMRHCIHQWLLQWACWVHCQGLTTLYKLHTHWEDARHQWCVVKNVARILSSESEILALTRVNTSAASRNEALYSPMIVAVGLLGPLPRSDNPLQATCTLGTCQTC